MILPNATLFPDALLLLHILKPRYRRILSDVLDSYHIFGVALRQSDAGMESPMPIVGVGMVGVCIDAKDGTPNLLLMGMALRGMSRRGEVYDLSFGESPGDGVVRARFAGDRVAARPGDGSN